MCLMECYKHDSCFALKKVWILLYVDDILLMGEKYYIEEIVKLLQENFKAKDLGEIKIFLGMNIFRDETKLINNQTIFIGKLLGNFNMKNCTGKNTPTV